MHQHKSRIATPLQRFTSTSQASGSLPHCRGSPAQVKGSPPHCRGSPAQVKHLDPYPIAEVHQHKSRDRHPIAEVSTASQPHCRGRYSQHRNPIAEVFTASQPHCTGRYSQHRNPIAEGGIHSIATPLQRGLLFGQIRRLQRACFFGIQFFVEKLFPELPGRSITCFDFTVVLRCFASGILRRYLATPATQDCPHSQACLTPEADSRQTCGQHAELQTESDPLRKALSKVRP